MYSLTLQSALTATHAQVLNLSEEIIGLSVVAWGNSVVDLVANTIISKNGFPGMAFSACFGSPIFSKSFVNLTLFGLRVDGVGL